MTQIMQDRVKGLLTYLSNPDERANEDLALVYFRSIFEGDFQRQRDARRADGYVPGSFVLELKGRTSDWYSGLLQALAYHNEGLDFAQVAVAAKHFLAIWHVRDIPEQVREAVASEDGAPNEIGRRLAKTLAGRRNDLLSLAVWNGADLFTPLFESDAELTRLRLQNFEEALRSGRRVRQRVTLRNFPGVLREMLPYFDPEQPVRAVRAFYSMIYAWNESSTLQISSKALDQATLGGETILALDPAKRVAFKDFVENRYLSLEPGAGYDDFFAKYDMALDAVDPDFRRKHGIFFTDLHLSRFAMWVVKQHIPKLGQDYLVIDPACGSGNLVTNWRAPLELRHKVVSEIEPELLFAVEQRLKGDQWHHNRFTVVPKVSDNKGLNFLDRSAAEYLEELRIALADKGHTPDKPLAFLCNPPYRGDDDQAVSSAGYSIHPSILPLTGIEGSSERYCCFLAQMKLICEQAKSSGLPGDSLLFLFTKSSWLTNRAIFKQIRTEMLGSFENVAGILVDGSEFFDVKGKWPVAFTIWRYKGSAAQLNGARSVMLQDLTWLKRRDLEQIEWGDEGRADAACRALLHDDRSKVVPLGTARRSIHAWSDATRLDFMRTRRKAELHSPTAGGLPARDSRRTGRKTYGETDGEFIGFMDNLTPCRLKSSLAAKPWFRLNAQFMDVKKNRCLSGPPTNRGYCASDLATAQALFFWFALTRTFLQNPYPMWTDSDDLWAPDIPEPLRPQIFSCSAAIVFAENECVETYFPANNPAPGSKQLYVSNPLTPLLPESFWSTEIKPHIEAGASPAGDALIRAVEELHAAWNQHLGFRHEVPVAYDAPYFVDARSLTRGAGLVQIKDYAIENHIQDLQTLFTVVQTRLRLAKSEFDQLVRSENGLNDVGAAAQEPSIEIPQESQFEKTLARRLALAGIIVEQMHTSPSFGRTKLAKVFYLAERQARLPLQTQYARQAAGPLDSRALYSEKVGIESLALKYGLFNARQKQRKVCYEPLEGLKVVKAYAEEQLGAGFPEVEKVIDLCKPLSTEQAEIVATLYACWDDLSVENEVPSDDAIIREFRQNWHPDKVRFSPARLSKALSWMREAGLTPSGRTRVRTNAKVERTKARPS